MGFVFRVSRFSLNVCLCICLETVSFAQGDCILHILPPLTSVRVFLWAEGLACLSLCDKQEVGETVMAGGLMPRPVLCWLVLCF